MTTASPESLEKNEVVRARYIPVLAPLFFPEDPVGPDVTHLLASLLRLGGMEDKGWDPYTESRAFLDDLYALMQFDLPENKFKAKELTSWRIALLFYNHIVEMSAPYEVLANLLRFKLHKGYRPDPFSDLLTPGDRKRYKRSGLFPKQKIEVIQKLSIEAGSALGELFDEFHRPDFRNAIAHSDFIFAENGFRCRTSNFQNPFELSYEQVDDLITKAKVFVGTFFGLEFEARRQWGEYAGKSLAYDPFHKGVLEILVDGEKLLNGFKVHWPNGSESICRRTQDGIVMTNCLLVGEGALSFFMGMFARRHGDFSPLVEEGAEANYTPLENGSPTIWAP